MSSPLAAVIAKSGILDESAIQEFRRWGVPVDEMAIGTKPTSLEDFHTLIQEALEGEGLVVEKVTDLQVITEFLRTQAIGSLHVVVGDQEADFDVTYGRSAMREFIFPWKGDAVAEEMTNGQTYLRIPDKTREDGVLVPSSQVFFSDCKTFYYGDQKAFMLCTPNRVIG